MNDSMTYTLARDLVLGDWIVNLGPVDLIYPVNGVFLTVRVESMAWNLHWVTTGTDLVRKGPLEITYHKADGVMIRNRAYRP